MHSAPHPKGEVIMSRKSMATGSMRYPILMALLFATSHLVAAQAQTGLPDKTNLAVPQKESPAQPVAEVPTAEPLTELSRAATTRVEAEAKGRLEVPADPAKASATSRPAEENSAAPPAPTQVPT